MQPVTACLWSLKSAVPTVLFTAVLSPLSCRRGTASSLVCWPASYVQCPFRTQEVKRHSHQKAEADRAKALDHLQVWGFMLVWFWFGFMLVWFGFGEASDLNLDGKGLNLNLCFPCHIWTFWGKLCNNIKAHFFSPLMLQSYISHTAQF